MSLFTVQENHTRSITKDEWTLFLEFTKTVGENFEGYEEDGNYFIVFQCLFS